MNEQMCKEILKQKEPILMKKKSEEVKKEEVKVVVKKKQKEVVVKKKEEEKVEGLKVKGGKVVVEAGASRKAELEAQRIFMEKRQKEIDAKNEAEIKSHNEAVMAGGGQDSAAATEVEDGEVVEVKKPKPKKSNLKIVPPVIEPVKKPKTKTKEVTTAVMKKRPEQLAVPEPEGKYFTHGIIIPKTEKTFSGIKKLMKLHDCRVAELRNGDDGFRMFELPFKIKKSKKISYFEEAGIPIPDTLKSRRQLEEWMNNTLGPDDDLNESGSRKIECREGVWMAFPDHRFNDRTGRPERTGIKKDSNGHWRLYYGSYRPKDAIVSKRLSKKKITLVKKSAPPPVKKVVAPPVVKKINKNNKRRQYK